MNEQLIVKNFGPIKDATVDFKKVTVFIGPTGGGKSTLAKLLYMIEQGDVFTSTFDFADQLIAIGLENYIKSSHYIKWSSSSTNFFYIEKGKVNYTRKIEKTYHDHLLRRNNNLDYLANDIINNNSDNIFADNKSSFNYIKSELENIEKRLYMKNIFTKKINSYYFPSDRIIVSLLGYSWARLLKGNVNIPHLLLEFADNYNTARNNINQLNIPFLNSKYTHENEHDYIYSTKDNGQLRLSETASGIQSAIPLLILLEHLSLHQARTQSFIIEEPELNLYPTAQQGLLNWLIEKCTFNENSLTITTHSPYILSHLNLLLYAYQVAHKHPNRADDVAKIVPRESWINPKEFSCYQVENGGVQSLVNKDLGLIDNNELDALSGDAADAFDNLIRLSKGIAVK